MTDSPAALILDDGELDDVQRVIESLGVEFARVRGGAIASTTPPPTSLLVATPRRISAVSIPDDQSEDPPIRIVVVTEDSNTLREQLRSIGFDYIVRRPVHPEALRLLIMHGLYRGDERRREPRVAVGLEVSFQTGELPRRATLVDLSTGGCRLLSEYELESGRQIQVQISETLGATESLTVEGRILRSEFDERIGADGMYASAVIFENLSVELRHELEWVVEDKNTGPPVLRDADSSQSTAVCDANPTSKQATVASGSNRNQARRTIVEKVSPSCPPDPRAESTIDPAPSTSKEIGEYEPQGVPVEVKMRGLDEEPPYSPG